ncbi:MAG: hypothetical protein JWQ88_1600 [Rhodoferax sp.]|nr:hypothetical protein [Rhodoferax sp.]
MPLNPDQTAALELAAALTEAQFRKAREVGRRLLNGEEADFPMIDAIAQVMASNYQSVSAVALVD